MTAGIYNVALDQNADNIFNITWTDQAGAIIDLTGYSAELMVKHSYLDTLPLLTLTSVPGGGITLGGSAGTIAIDFSPLMTLSLPPNTVCYYDLRLTSAAGLVTRLLQGQVNNHAAVTK